MLETVTILVALFVVIAMGKFIYVHYLSRSKGPLPDAMVGEFEAWLQSGESPAVHLVPDAEGSITAAGLRLGGPAWICAGDSWPVDSQGRALEFLAQVDFSQMPELPEWPNKGLLQFFVAPHHPFGICDDNATSPDIAIRFLETVAKGALVAQADNEEGRDKRDSPFEDKRIREHGVALRPLSYDDSAIESVEGEDRAAALYEYDVPAGVSKRIEELIDGRSGKHHVGGYPSFTQGDIRYEEPFSEFDICLLNLTSKDGLAWGDMGEANFLIRSADLKARRFDRAILYWDCT